MWEMLLKVAVCSTCFGLPGMMNCGSVGLTFTEERTNQESLLSKSDLIKTRLFLKSLCGFILGKTSENIFPLMH